MYMLPGRVTSSRSHTLTMVEVHSWAKTVLSVFAAFNASMIASSVKAGPVVSAARRTPRTGINLHSDC
jgi:hypothetical protein